MPPELPQPLRVGQAVVARHPTTRQLHDGTLLTVMGSRCRVQFNRSELMTEVVRWVWGCGLVERQRRAYSCI